MLIEEQQRQPDLQNPVIHGEVVLNGGLPNPTLVHMSSEYNELASLRTQLQAAQDLNSRYDDVLRGLACYLSVGGYNSDGLIAPEVADDKIRWGIDHLFRVGQTQGQVPAAPPVGWLYEAKSRFEPETTRIGFYRRRLNSAMWVEHALYKIPQAGEGQAPSAWLYVHAKGEELVRRKKESCPPGMTEMALYAGRPTLFDAGILG